MNKFYLTFFSGLLITGSSFSQGFEVLDPVAPMNVTRIGHAAVTLDNGHVLVLGGHTQGFDITATAEIYDPAANIWTLYNTPNPHDGVSFVRLLDGRYMFLGGYSSPYGVGQSQVTTIYDPVSGEFSNGPLMNTARASSTTALLADGRVLVAGNWYNTGDAELFDPETNTFTALGVPVQQRSYPLVLPCADGSALVIGGYGIYGEDPFTDVVQFDPETNSFSTVADQIISGETGWNVYWAGNSQSIEETKMANGNYVFMIFKSISSTESYYGFAEFNPVTKSITKITATPEFPMYTGTAPTEWAFGINPMRHPESGYVYVMAVNTATGPILNRLYAINPASGELSIPEGEMVFDYYLYSSSKAWIGNNLLCTGGTIDGSNFNITNQVVLLHPVSSLGVMNQNPDFENGSVYPNPVNGSSVQLRLPIGGADYIEIIDLNGKVLKQIGVKSREGIVSVDVQHLPAGLYVLRTIGQGEVHTEKFVIERN